MVRTKRKSFYTELPLLGSFSEVTNSSVYTELPEDWIIGMSDIVGSTDAVERGLYKTVNMIGAAVISSQINTLGEVKFPFIFGGDGATFAIPAEFAEASREQIEAVIAWAAREFDFELRGAMIPVSVINNAGHSITVARFSASDHVDYAMFRGSGISWAEQQMKTGNFIIKNTTSEVLPNLTGLSCRWTPTQSQNGTIVSLVIQPSGQNRIELFDKLAKEITEIIANSNDGCRPVPADGPNTTWPPKGLALEAHASRGNRSLLATKLQLLAKTFLGWLFFKTEITAGEFDPRHYRKTISLNADFQKFEEGLKMTLDCDRKTQKKLITILNRAERKGIIKYGMHEQDESMMTCIVPSVTTDNHIHFIDGASGGYTAAAKQLKSRIAH